MLFIIVSMESDRTSSLYKATITSFHYAYLLLPVWLTSEKESLKFYFNTLAERERQTGFNFNDCQFQVEQKDSPGSTLYKITIRSCRCEHGFQASVGKITPSGFEETALLSPLYFSPVDMRDETMPDDHISSMAINRTALIQDGVQVKSLEFVIHTLGNDFKTDVIDEYVYRYTLI